MRFIIHEGLKINEDFLEFLSANGLDSFESLLNYAGGSIVKKKPARSVVRIELDKRAFYLKRHYIFGFQGLKGLFLKRPPDGAENEWDKMVALNECGFSTMTPVAYGEAKIWGMPQVSLTLTEELYGCVKVKNYIPTLSSKYAGMKGVFKKRELVRTIALIAKRFHELGFNHQDFYFEHFLINTSTEDVSIVDLQRVQRRERPVKRWLIKDLAQTAFSAKEMENFSRTDLARFGHAYFGVDRFTTQNKRFIKKIIRKAGRIRRHTVKMYSAKGLI